MHCESVVWALSLASLIQAHLSYAQIELPRHGREANPNSLYERDTLSVPRPSLGSLPYGAQIYDCTVPGTVALTFDDGPSEFTSSLLDMLKAANVKATFFITGDNNGKGEIDRTDLPWPAIIRRTFQEGHQIASHTWTHPYLDQITSAQRINEMVRNEQAFVSILGFFPTYMRPPYGFCRADSGCLSDLGKLGYHLINWSLDTNDWQNDSPTLIQNSKNTVAAAFANANPQAQHFLFLEHDTHEWTVKSLVAFIIDTVHSKGFRFATVGECLNDPSANWYRNATTGGVLTSQVLKNQNSGSSSTTTASTIPALPASSPSTTTTSSSSVTIVLSERLTGTSTTTVPTTTTTTTTPAMSTTSSTTTAVSARTSSTQTTVLTSPAAVTRTNTTSSSSTTHTTTSSPTAQTTHNGSATVTVDVTICALMAVMIFMFSAL